MLVMEGIGAAVVLLVKEVTNGVFPPGVGEWNVPEALRETVVSYEGGAAPLGGTKVV